MTLYVVHLKVKARSQKVMTTLKSQTHVPWSTLTKEIDNSVYWAMWSNFQQFKVEGQARSSQKGQISNSTNVNKTSVYQMPFVLRNPVVPFILFCDVSNMLK